MIDHLLSLKLVVETSAAKLSMNNIKKKYIRIFGHWVITTSRVYLKMMMKLKDPEINPNISLRRLVTWTYSMPTGKNDLFRLSNVCLQGLKHRTEETSNYSRKNLQKKCQQMISEARKGIITLN